jgi:cell division septation protein DedD
MEKRLMELEQRITVIEDILLRNFSTQQMEGIHAPAIPEHAVEAPERPADPEPEPKPAAEATEGPAKPEPKPNDKGITLKSRDKKTPSRRKRK